MPKTTAELKEMDFSDLMIIAMTVEGGEVLNLFRVVKIEDNYITVKEADNLVAEDLKQSRFLPTEQISHFLAINSPGCRYVKVGGVWKKVCR